MKCLWSLLLALRVVWASKLSRERAFVDTANCKGSACCGMAHYPVGDPRRGGATQFSSVFSVPGLPEAVVDDSITDFIYFNIFFAGGAPSGVMNQFVPQLMLGQPLCNSTGWPWYKPLWNCDATHYIFGSQYFFEIKNRTTEKTESHAATGDVYPVSPGEKLYTKFALDSEYVWTLEMGVVGDGARISVLRVPEPYMGLLRDETDSWDEPAFNRTFVNSCWELYGMRDRAHYPSSGSVSEMLVERPENAEWEWFTDWVEDEVPDCPGAPTSTISEEHNATTQRVVWSLGW